MKVLHIIGGGDVGGAKSHVLSLVKELSKHIDVTLVSLRPGQFAQDSISMGINTIIIKSGNILKDIKSVIELISDGNYEIIHSHGAKANMISVIASHFVKIATISTVHSDYKLDYLQSIYKTLSFGLINTLALRFMNYYIGVSENFKKMLMHRKFDASKIFIVYNGIDFNKPIGEYSREVFAKKYKFSFEEDTILVGILARLDPVKGIPTFIQAAEVVTKKFSNVKFIIGGPGLERKQLEKKVLELNLSDKVLFSGVVDDAYEFMSSIDINVLTSLSESFPYVILEGARLKRATVSSNVGGISDLIKDGSTGFLFTPKDYNTLANHLIKLVEDSELRIRLGENIYETAKKNFSLENMCKTQLGIYEKIAINERLKDESK